MLHELKGDILLTGAEAISHGVAANDPMNQGLAEALHKNYPAMHKDYHHWCHIEHREPGGAWIWSGVGGLAWEDVEPLIRNQLGDVTANLYVHVEYVPGQRANEPGL